MKTLSLMALTALLLTGAAFANEKASHKAAPAAAAATTDATAEQNGEMKKEELAPAKKKMAKRVKHHGKTAKE